MNELNSIYEKIGNNLVNCMNNNWDKIVLNIECNGKMAGTTSKYLNDGKWIDNLDRRLGADVLIEIIKLYEITKSLSFIKWNRAVFTLESSGDFNMDFKWDQELQDKWDGKK